MGEKKWMFVFAGLSGLGGLAGFLYWLGIKPKDLWGWHVSLAIPHWLWLVFGLLLFILSIGLSIYGLLKLKKPAALPQSEVDRILSGLPQHQPPPDDESRRLREHLKDAEERADRLLKESKQLDRENAALEKNNQELNGRISEVEQRWNNSALLSGQFLQEAATLSGDLILVWLREHCPTKTQFPSTFIAENLGISRDAALHGLELLQREYRLVTRPLQNVDGWEYIPSLTALQPTLKATTRLSKATTPTLGLTLRSASLEPYDENPDRWYRRKLTLYFSNDGDEIHLGIGKWIADYIGTQSGRPPRTSYYLKNNLGKWDGEADNKIIPQGRWVKMWVGLDSSVPDAEFKKVRDETRLGTLEIPSEISGTPVKIRTDIVVSRELLSKL